MEQTDKPQNNLINDQDFDAFFRTHLESHEVAPEQSNWQKIKEWTALGFLYQVLTSNWTKVAASVLFLLAVSTLFIQNFPINNTSTAKALLSPVEPPLIETDAKIQQDTPSNNDFVLDIKDEKLDLDVRKEIIEKELDEYLAFLLEDEDEFADIIDSAEISKYLEPVVQLPIDEMFAIIPQLPDQEEFTILAPLETRITLPHRFVEKGEDIEDYLLIYENNQNRE